MTLRVLPGEPLDLFLPAPAPPGQSLVGFEHLKQGRLAWCWAACLSAASKFFQFEHRDVPTMVSALTCCSGCGPNPPRGCVVGLNVHNLPESWARARYQSSGLLSTVDLSVIKTEIAAQQPVQAHLQNDAHVVLFVGWFQPVGQDPVVIISDSMRTDLIGERFNQLVPKLGWKHTVTGVMPDEDLAGFQCP